jgi:hypothetical protein
MKPRDVTGKPISERDPVRRVNDRAIGNVDSILPGAFVVVRWPSGLYSKLPAKTLRVVA